MATIDFDTLRALAPAKPLRRQPSILRLLLAMFRRHWRAKRTYLELSRLDERLLYDIGIDPADVRDALQNRPGLSLLLHPMRRQFDVMDKRRHPRTDAGQARSAASDYPGEPASPEQLIGPANAGIDRI